MAATCKYCGNQDVTWSDSTGKWVLLTANGQPHRCPEYERAHPWQPGIMRRKKSSRSGAFLRWYGPRAGRIEALLVETRIDPDTPAGFYLEPTKSPFEQCNKARGIETVGAY